MPAIRPHQKTRLHLRDSATVDFGPEGATLTANGTVSVADDVLTFPGSASDYIDAVQAATDTSTTVYSVSGWFNADSIGAAFQTIAVHATGGGSPPMLIRLTTSSTLQFFHSGVSVSSGTVSASQWYHFAAVWDGSNIELFLDGVSQGTAAYSTATTLGTAWEIGNWTTNSTHYAGKLADLRFNNYALTAGEVFDLYNEGRGFDLPERRQLPGTRLHLLDGLTDAGFYGAEVTNTGVTYENGVFGGFNGVEGLRVSADPVSGYGNELSFAAWIHPTQYGPSGVPGFFGRLCSKGPTEFEVYLTSGSGQPNDAIHVNVNGTGASVANVLSLNVRQHVAVSISGTTASVYVNAVLVGTLTVGTPTSASSDLGVGNRIDGTAAMARGFVGSMSDIHYTHTALSAGDVANLYRKGIPALRGPEVLRIDPARYSGSGDLIDQTGGGNDAELQDTASVTGGVLVTDGSVNTYARTSAANLGLDKGTIVARMRLGVSGDDTEGTSFFWDCVDARIALFRNGASRNELRMFVNGRYRDFDPHEWDADTTFTVAMVYEKATDTLQLYWDGVAIAGEVAQGSWGSTALGTFFTIGAGFDGTGNLTAEYDWLNVYDEVLTPDQIAYLSAKGIADPFPVPFGNLGGETLSIQPSLYTGSGDLLDQSGNGNDLTLPSGYTVASGVINSDGTADGPATSVDIQSTAGTVAFWVKTTDTIFMLGTSSASSFFGACQAAGGGHTTNITNETTYVDGVADTYTRQTLRDALNDGNWHHFAITGDFGSNWGNLELFNYELQAQWRLTGEVDDIRIDNTRKYSAEEIKLLASARGVELPNTRDAKLAVLPSYDDASNGGTSVLDYSGNQTVVTFNNTVTWVADTSDDNGGIRYLELDAGDLSTPIIQWGDEWTIGGWFRPNTGSGNRIAFYNGATGSNGAGVLYDGDWDVLLGGVAFGGTYADTLDEWQPIWLVRRGGQVFFYQGEVENADTTSTPNAVSTNALEIGAASFIGDSDDFLVWDRALTPAEIARFSERRNIFGDAYVAPPVSAGEWKIDILLFS